MIEIGDNLTFLLMIVIIVLGWMVVTLIKAKWGDKE